VKPLTEDLLNHLIATDDTPALSLYMPVCHEWPQSNKNAIALKNALATAQAALAQLGVEETAADAMLEPLRAVEADVLFAIHDLRTLAVFATPATCEFVELPVDTGEKCVVSPETYVIPLLPVLSAAGSYFVLELTQNRVRLFRRSGNELVDVTPDSIPASLADALPYENPEEQIQYHTGTGSSDRQGHRRAMFHGQGAVADHHKEWIERFCQRVDKGLDEALRGDPIPLILAGTQPTVGIFRKVTRYPKVVDETLDGNPDNWTASELFRSAHAIAQPILTKQEKEAANAYADSECTDKTMHDVPGALRAATEGRVRALFVASDVDLWGKVDALRPEADLDLHKQQQPGDTEILNRIALAALGTDAQVYARPSADLPGEKANGVAAVLRY
jgi:hypothetical protein